MFEGLMPSHGAVIVTSYARPANNLSYPAKPPKDATALHRTVSDITFQRTKDAAAIDPKLHPISEADEVRCECCSMSEECTPEYVSRVRERFSGRWICGLCSEAVKEEGARNGGTKEEALTSHMGTCLSFNKLGRAYPVLCQAEAMREMLRKSHSDVGRAKPLRPKDHGGHGIGRSSSCIASITRGMKDPK